MSVQRRLAEIAAAGPPASDAEAAMVRRSIRDAIAVALIADDQVSTSIAFAHAAANGRAGPAWLWGTDRRVDPATAAFVNGTMVQALDYDDIASAPAAHMSSVVVPAVAALADRFEPDRSVEAIVAGLRAAEVISGLVSREAYMRGLQPTHTIGAVAAVGALGRALGFDADQISHALGFVCIQAIGLRANTGTPAKPMQSGLAAAAAVRSVLLAADGGRSGRDAVDAFLTLLGVDDEALAAARRTEPPAALDLSIKLFPSCGAVHSAAEAVLDVRSQLGVDGDAAPPPESMEVRTPPRMPKAMHFAWPTNADEARFGFAYCIDTAWRRGALEPSDFTEDAIAARADDGPPSWLTIVPDTTYDPQGEQCRVIASVGGRTASAYVEHRDGYPERPLAPERADAKARACLTTALGARRAEAAFAALSGDRAIHDIGPILIRETTQ
jgi:2-methylcitrate dehydratase PrpD